MSRLQHTHDEILALFGLLGWRPGDDAEDLAHMRAAARPTRIRAADVLARIKTGLPPDDDDSSSIVMYRNPVADGLTRAARNGGDIPAEIEARMRADREQAKRTKRSQQRKT